MSRVWILAVATILCVGASALAGEVGVGPPKPGVAPSQAESVMSQIESVREKIEATFAEIRQLLDQLADLRAAKPESSSDEYAAWEKGVSAVSSELNEAHGKLAKLQKELSSLQTADMPSAEQRDAKRHTEKLERLAEELKNETEQLHKQLELKADTAREQRKGEQRYKAEQPEAQKPLGTAAKTPPSGSGLPMDPAR